MTHVQNVHPDLQYATPVQARGMTTGMAGLLLLVGGLGLMIIGGCFLIGVMMIVTQGFVSFATKRPLSSGEETLMVILYLLAFTSLGGGGYLLVQMLRRVKAIFEPGLQR